MEGVVPRGGRGAGLGEPTAVLGKERPCFEEGTHIGELEEADFFWGRGEEALGDLSSAKFTGCFVR